MEQGCIEANPTPLYVRRLGLDDFEAVEDLNASCTHVMRHEKPSGYDALFLRSLNSIYFKGHEQYALFGVFRDDRLEACASAYLWSTFPYYSTGNLKVRPGAANAFSSTLHPLSLSIRAVLEYTEARGYFRGYMVRSAVRWPVDRVIRSLERTLPELGRYHREVEFLIPQGTRPKFAYAWALMGRRTWDHDLVVETVSLVQSARPTPGPV